MENYVQCPHCSGTILIMTNEINCQIFRHGVFKNGNQLGPHTSKEECDRVFRENEIFGCGKPFRFDGKTISICEYI